MSTTIVHYVIATRDDAITPLCGDWSAGTSWTTVPDAVRCPRCAPRLRAPRENGPADDPPPRPLAHA